MPTIRPRKRSSASSLIQVSVATNMHDNKRPVRIAAASNTSNC